MWIIFAIGSALFAGLTAILAKCGIKHTDSNVATAVRTIVVFIFSWVMVLLVGSFDGIYTISNKTLLFLVLSGLATGGSWLCYFKALQLGNINKVVPIDKSSIILTLLLAFFILGEPVSIGKAIGIVAIGLGTFLMIQKKKEDTPKKENRAWFFFALLSAIFASLTAILGKIGISDIESNLGTAIRTGVVLIMDWIVVFVHPPKTEGERKWYNIPQKELIFIILSGFATGGSWLCYYKALHDGQASIVVPIDKLSILITIIFSRIVFNERLTKKAAFGLVLIVLGTLSMLL